MTLKLFLLKLIFIRGIVPQRGKMIDCIIVGAGFAGSVIAHKLATEQNKKVLIVEKRSHIGGNCYDFVDGNGINIHKYGPHLFHADNKEVYDFLSKFTEFEPYEHIVLASIEGKNVNIPFNFNTLYQLFPEERAREFEKALLKHFSQDQKVPILELREIDNAELQFLANYIYEKMFVNYTAKQWGVKPEEIDAAVTARVPVFVGSDNRYFHDKYQAIPKDGYTKIFEKMLDHPNIETVLNIAFSEICTIQDNKIYFGDEVFAGKVIYTGPIDELFNYRYGILEYRSIDLQFETVDQEYFQEAAVVNYPNDHKFTRITEFKHIHSAHTAKTTILREYPQPYAPNENIPYYPVFTKVNQERYLQYEMLAAKFENLILVGRLAEFKYYDMDDVVERALEVYMDYFR